METKYYYSYNTATKTYSGKHPALKNPQRPSEYLLPAKATFIEPPQTGTNEIAIWNGQNWDIESDFRGQTQVNIETKEISTIEYVGAIKDGFQKISEDVAEDIKTNPEKYKNIGGNGNSDASGYYIYFDASLSSSIYGNSSTVQPPSQIVHICIKYK